jgi:hypothetical protein
MHTSTSTVEPTASSIHLTLCLCPGEVVPSSVPERLSRAVSRRGCPEQCPGEVVPSNLSPGGFSDELSSPFVTEAVSLSPVPDPLSPSFLLPVTLSQTFVFQLIFLSRIYTTMSRTLVPMLIYQKKRHNVIQLA